MIHVSSETTPEQRLLLILDDAMMASIWVAVVLMALVMISFVVLICARGCLVAFVGELSGVSAEAMAIIWISALALFKLTALSFASIAFGLWVWKRRVARRMAG